MQWKSQFLRLCRAPHSRKNFTGCRSERGALVAAVFYSLFETAKLCRVDPVDYVHRAVERALAEPGAVTLPEPLRGR